MDSVTNKLLSLVKDNKNILLIGPGGCGKTFIIKKLASILIKKKNIALTATTGIAAVNLSIPEDKIIATTLHSWAGIGLANKPANYILSRIIHDEKSRNKWEHCHILIIDEISMLGGNVFDLLNYLGQKVRHSDKPFGGLQLILSGDFLQLPPVKDKWLFESDSWNNIKFSSVILEEPKRYSDLTYFDFLLRLRKGEQNSQDIEFLNERFKAYTDLKSSLTKEELTIKPTILYSKKINVDIENKEELDKLPAPIENFEAHDSFEFYTREANKDYYVRLLDELIPSFIELKKYAQVLLKVNLDVKNGLVNGSRGVVVDIINEETVKVRWISGKENIIKLHQWEIEDKNGKAIRSQIPLILAWAFTIHKIQGCTLDYAVCDIGPSVFDYAQVYVALSRVRDSKGLYISDFYPKSIKVNPKALEFMNKIEKETNNSLFSKEIQKPIKLIVKQLEFIDAKPNDIRCFKCLELINKVKKCCECKNSYCEQCLPSEICNRCFPN